MKKETLLTAVVFLIVGFLAGYITEAQLSWNAAQKAPMATTGGAPSGMPSGAAAEAGQGGTMPGLPEGHPPIDSAAIVKQLQEAVEKNPQDPEIPLRLANFLYDQRQFQQAIEWYQKSLALNPNNVDARTDLGTAYYYLGQPAQALKEYNQSLAMNPNHKPTLANLVVVNLEGTHDLRAARQAWDRLRSLDPSNPVLEGLKQKLDTAQASAAVAPAAPQTR
jgi:cytochrome c-type biogenesis protein CcmH/NrfG